jgi:hypothetical protein
MFIVGPPVARRVASLGVLDGVGPRPLPLWAGPFHARGRASLRYAVLMSAPPAGTAPPLRPLP